MQGVKQLVCLSVIVVVIIIVGTKIARSRVLDICACCKHNQAVEIGEKLICTRFEFLRKAYKCYKSCIFCSACLWFIDHTHSFKHNSMQIRLCMLKHSVGKGRHVMKQCCNTMLYSGYRACGVCALQSSSYKIAITTKCGW